MTTQSSMPLNLPDDKTLLDVVMYMATLVSKTNDVDTQLDRVRTITARRTAKELTKEDNQTLRDVYDYLEDYLVKQEALRSFTRESLREKITEYLQGNERSSGRLRPLITVWAIAIGGAIMAALIPESILSTTVTQTLAITLFFAIINMGAVWMFWTGLANFKDKIRQAYLPICLGIGLASVTLLLTPIVVALGQDRSVWYQYIVSGLTLPLAELLLYIGVRRFAQIGGATSKFLSGKLVFGLCLAAAVVVNILPRPESGVPDWAMAISLTILASSAVLTAVTAKISANVRQVLSTAYKQPMAWFTAYLLVSTFSCVQYAFLQMTATIEHPYDPRGIGLLVLVVSALVALKASTSFNQINATIVRKK